MLVGLLVFPAPGQALECEGRFVSRGDRKFEVRSACGKPALVQSWEEELVVFERVAGDTLEQLRTSQVVNIEEWTYNFGPLRFLYFLRFDNGRLSVIESGDYGFELQRGDTPSSASDCRRFIEPGDRMIEVLRHCGEPRDRETTEEIRTRSLAGEESSVLRKQKVRVRSEEWAYAFGPSRFLFFVRFENGRVTTVESSGYGR